MSSNESDAFSTQIPELDIEGFEPNELDLEYLSVLGLNPWVGHDSSARQYMLSSHISQALVIKGATERRVQTGMEQEFGKYTFASKMPENGKIIKVIDRYPNVIGPDQINFNPETLVIYEDEKTKELGCFTIERFKSYHQYFGFEQKLKPEINKLVPGQYVKKDTIFADSPNITETGGYTYGIELNMCFMTHPSVSEDGIMVSEDVLDRFAFKVFETRVVEFGNDCIPLNLYGTETDYKPIPDIGDYIRDDGILMGTRSYDDETAPVEMSIRDTMEIDFVFDKLVYVKGPGGRVVDIKIHHDDYKPSTTPEGMERHLNKYTRAMRKYYEEIINTERRIRLERNKKFGEGKVDLKPELHRLIYEAHVMLDKGGTKASSKLNRLYRRAPLDDYRIEFTIEYEIVPRDGFKMTGCHGDKGVICKIAKPEEMPVDADGNRADLVMDPGSTISRMNLGRLYEHYIGCAARDVGKRLRGLTGVQGTREREIRKQLADLPPEHFASAFSYLLGFYEIISPKQFMYFRDEVSDADKIDHLAFCIVHGPYIYLPPNNPPESVDIIKQLEKKYQPVYGPVRYIGNSGKVTYTEEPFRIGPFYMILLEKIGDDWASVSSGKLQHFGVLSPVTKSEKYSYPFRNSATRTIGETEGRIFAAYCGREAIAEMIDRNNSPITHKNVVWNILNADQPGNIEQSVDRDVIPLGNSKPLQLVNHIAMCGGYQFVYTEEEQE